MAEVVVEELEAVVAVNAVTVDVADADVEEAVVMVVPVTVVDVVVADTVEMVTVDVDVIDVQSVRPLVQLSKQHRKSHSWSPQTQSCPETSVGWHASMSSHSVTRSTTTIEFSPPLASR